MVKRLVRPGPCVPCALRALCVCVVRSPPFLTPLRPWLQWLVWLRVRPRLQGRHVGLAEPGIYPGLLGTAPCSVLLGWAGRSTGAGQSPCRSQHVVGGGGRGPRPVREIREVSEAGARARAPARGQRGAGVWRLRAGPATGSWTPARGLITWVEGGEEERDLLPWGAAHSEVHGQDSDESAEGRLGRPAFGEEARV